MPSLSGFIRNQWHRAGRKSLEWRCARRRPRMSVDRAGWQISLDEPTAFYLECLRYFYQELPPEIRAHRLYFREQRRDMIYIDGNHDYEVVIKDWELCSSHTKKGGIIVLDDSALTTSFNPPPYAGTRGHPGPSRLAQEIDRSTFKELLQVGHNRVFQRLS
jgi:Methyltransferase domain